MRNWMITGGSCAALIALTAIAYTPVLECGFVDFDDDAMVIHNRHVHEGLTAQSIAYAWTTFDSGNWIPLTWMSYLLDVSLFGVQPASFHAVNVGWHAANVCLLFLFLQRAIGRIGQSFAVAALFAVHPLHVESVAWISERKDVLSTFFLIVALLLYERFARRPDSLLAYSSVAAALVLGLLCKSMLVTLPVLLLLIDIWPLRRWSGVTTAGEIYPQRTTAELLKEKLPLLAIALLDGVITIQAQQAGQAVKSLALISGQVRGTNAVRSVGWYLWKTFCPTQLCAFYPLRPESIPWAEVAASAAAAGLISALVWRLRRERPHLVVGWAWFIISLLPVLGLLQVGTQAHADRYVYVPHIGLLIVLAGELALVGRNLVRWQYGLVMVLLMTAAVACIPITRAQVLTWKDTLTLWRHAIAVSPDNHLAHFYLGVALAQQERFDEAAVHFRNSLEHPKLTLTSAAYLGDIHARRREWEPAAHYFASVLRIDPGNRLAAERMPIVLSQLERERDQRRSTQP